MDDEAFRDHLRSGIDGAARGAGTDAGTWDRFAGRVSLLDGDFEQAQLYDRLQERLDRIRKSWGEETSRIFYLAVPPRVIEPIARRMQDAGLLCDRAHSRIVVEKPFGSDLESVRRLNRLLEGTCAKTQIYRIDHYLGHAYPVDSTSPYR